MGDTHTIRPSHWFPLPSLLSFVRLRGPLALCSPKSESCTRKLRALQWAVNRCKLKLNRTTMDAIFLPTSDKSKLVDTLKWKQVLHKATEGLEFVGAHDRHTPVHTEGLFTPFQAGCVRILAYSRDWTHNMEHLCLRWEVMGYLAKESSGSY